MADVCHYADLETAVDDADRLGRFAALVDRHAGDGVLLTDAGDTLAPLLLGAETDGGHVPRVHETLETDLATVGNHDLDHGVDALLSTVATSPATYLAANLAVDGVPLAARPGAARVVRRRVGGHRVALTGVTTPTVADHPAADTGRLSVDPVVPAVRAAFDGVDADRRVVVSHAGHVDERIARECDVDCVLGGHVHDHHHDRVGGTPVARPRPRGEHLLAVSLDQGVTVTTRTIDEERAPGAVETARDLRAAVGLDDPVTTLDGSIPRDREALRPESAAGNLVADAFRAAAGADLALCNAGTLRAGPPLSGTVTVGDCRSLSPFDNEVHTTTLSGAELRRLLASCPTVTESDAVDAHLGGARVTYRRNGAWTLRSARVGDEPLVEGRSYAVAAPSIVFHSEGFGPLTVERIERTHAHQHDAVERYLREAGPGLAERVAPEGRVAVE